MTDFFILDNIKIYAKVDLVEKFNEIINFSDYTYISLETINTNKLELNVVKDNHKTTILLTVKQNHIINIDSNVISSGVLMNMLGNMFILRHIFNKIYYRSVECQEKLETVYCKDNKCPICKSKMIYTKGLCLAQHESIICKNGCYSVMRPREEELDTIDFLTGFSNFFERKDDDTLYFNNSHSYKIATKEDLNEIINTINYWKTNDRYLTKLIGGV